jgi:quinol-cytochrome oxidoreductase complex cytochrome b subunit
MFFLKKDFIIHWVDNLLISHPTPSNITYFWNFGSLAGLSLVIQITTGIFLAMNYVPNIDYAFISVERIMRDVNYGWLVRYIHSNCASFFFIVVYIHIFRAMYYSSFLGKNINTWFIGLSIYILMMAVSFFGYVLPWGQMSLWGATVITNFFSVVFFIGDDIVSWLWGGFSVNNATLNRFFSLHFFLPFLIIAFSILHLIYLHEGGNTNQLGITQYNYGYKLDSVENISFFPYFISKDLFGIFCYLFLLFIFVIYFPNFFGHPDNYILANPLSTPTHIVPEWYFLPFYAILRSIPNKLFGVILMFLSILTFYFLPFLNKFRVSSSFFKALFVFFFWVFVFDCFILGWIGSNAIEYPYYQIGQLSTFLYFFSLYVLFPLLCFFENFIVYSYLFSSESSDDL